MVGLWSPEPPSDPGGDHLPSHNPSDHFFMVVGLDEGDDDDGDETGAAPEGYELISDGEGSSVDSPFMESDEETDVETRCPVELQHSQHGIPLLRHHSTWNCSNSVSRQNDIEMDEERQAQVIAAMSNISLPPSAVPAWVASVPEEQWKQRLLERIQFLQSGGK